MPRPGLREVADHGNTLLWCYGSHYTCVAEAMPHEEPLRSVVGSLAPHVHHIHARVGYSDGPQARWMTQ